MNTVDTSHEFTYGLCGHHYIQLDETTALEFEVVEGDIYIPEHDVYYEDLDTAINSEIARFNNL